MRILYIFLFILFTQVQSQAAIVTLAWDAVNDTRVTGYKLYYGLASRVYNPPVDVKNVTQYTLTNIAEGVNIFFAVTAYDASGNESDYSIELPCFTLVPKILDGTIKPARTIVVSRGMEQTFEIFPPYNNFIKNLIIDNVTIAPNNKYTFLNIDRNHTISATFLFIDLPPITGIKVVNNY